MNRLFLVRHGENRANLTKEFSHRKIDYPLTPKGRLQAEQTAAALRLRSITAIYTSPLRRAHETALILSAGLGCPWQVIEEFREVNVGELEDRPPSQAGWRLHDQIVQDWLAGREASRFPGGENFTELWERIQRGLDQILSCAASHDLVIVGHGGWFTFTLPRLCPGAPLAELLPRPNHNCSISELTVAQVNGCWQGTLVGWADFSHLHGAAAELTPGTPDNAALPP